MAATIGFYLSGVIAIAIIFIGCRFLLAPSTAAAAKTSCYSITSSALASTDGSSYEADRRLEPRLQTEPSVFAAICTMFRMRR